MNDPHMRSALITDLSIHMSRIRISRSLATANAAMVAGAILAILCLGSAQRAQAHWGHLGEVAGHGHWIGIALAGAAAVMAAALAWLDRDEADEEAAKGVIEDVAEGEDSNEQGVMDDVPEGETADA